jgi:hypothetical protein
MTSKLGPYVRLEGISINQLPPGATCNAPSRKPSSTEKYSDGSASSGALPLETFVKAVFAEAVPFIDSVAPKASSGSTSPTLRLWKTKGTPKRYASSEAPVELYERVVTGKDLDRVEGMNELSADKRDETWFCRRSCHRNAKEKGTATWEEFVWAFKLHHRETEDAFTPGIIGAREAMSWDTEGLEVLLEANEGSKWTAFSVCVSEMKHKIDPKPLKNRTFPVLQIAANLEGEQEFIVVSIPLMDFEKSPCAEYARDKSLVVAAYVSVERVRILPENGEIEWIMATASDAGGVLPQWMQNLAVPGAIAKDVDMFLAWIPQQRNEQSKPSHVGAASDKSLPPAPAPSDTTSMSTVPPPPISKTVETGTPLTRAESANKDLPAAPS